jgi:hypothetical protein
MNYFPVLALNRDPPDLCFLSSWDNWRPAQGVFLERHLEHLFGSVILVFCSSGRYIVGYFTAPCGWLLTEHF